MGSGAQQLNFFVTEELVKKLQLGQGVVVEKGKESHTGSITEISSVLVPQTGLYPVKASVENTAFPEGSKVKLSLIKDSRSDVETLPVNVIYYENEEAFVYIFERTEGEEGVLRKKKLELGLMGEEKVEILSGLSPDDQVVSSWNNEMYDGAKVRLQAESGKAGQTKDEPVQKESVTESTKESVKEEKG